MSIKAIIQKLLSVIGYQLVKVRNGAALGLGNIEQMRSIGTRDATKPVPQGVLESWFHQETSVGTWKWAHYFEIYERHLKSFRGKSPRVLEIGVYKGGSLQMWKSYFGPESVIVGIDIDPICKQFENESSNIFVRIGDQESDKFLASVQKEFGLFDIVIDDGGHTTGQQIQSFLLLYFFAMKPEGVYLVEDLHTNYWPEYTTYPGGLTFIDLAGRLVHRLHDSYLGRDRELDRFDAENPDRFQKIEVSNFCAQTQSIHFYDSIVVIERGQKTIPYYVRN